MRTAFCIPALLAMLLMPLGAALAQSEEVADFKKVYAKKDKPVEKIEAIHVLDNVKGKEAAEALLPCFKEENGDIHNAAVSVLVKNDAPEATAVLVNIIKKDKAIRPWATMILGLGKRKEARPEIEKLLKEADFATRYRAIEALGRIGAIESLPLIMPLAVDSSLDIRVAVNDAIGLIADESASGAPTLINSLKDKEWRVRASAIKALAVVRTKDALEPLVKIVTSDEGRLVEDAAKTLKALTGRDFAGDSAQWNRWLAAYGMDPKWKLPTVAELAKAEAAQNAATPTGGTGVVRERKVAEFLGIQTQSKRMMFIIDCSGSMEDLILEKDRYKGGGYSGFRKMDIVREELARTIEKLPGNAEFSIVTFATKVNPWRKGALQAANIVTKTTASEYARGLEPIGGNSKDSLAGAGLSGAASSGLGETNTYGALMTALGNPQRGVLTQARADALPPIDTVFFLSDGRPTTGEVVDTDDILTAVREANAKLKITINVLAIGEFEKDFMKKLAAQNGGIFVDLGH